MHMWNKTYKHKTKNFSPPGELAHQSEASWDSAPGSRSVNTKPWESWLGFPAGNRQGKRVWMNDKAMSCRVRPGSLMWPVATIPSAEQVFSKATRCTLLPTVFVSKFPISDHQGAGYRRPPGMHLRSPGSSQWERRQSSCPGPVLWV